MTQFHTLPFIIVMVADIIIAGITIWAIYYGPRHAAKKTKESDEHREKERRKWEIFRALMRYREELEAEEFVDSFNLIEVEFWDHENVIDARRDLLRHLNTAVLTEGPELTQYIEDRRRKMVFLLQAIAGICNTKVNDLSIIYDAYTSHEREKNKKLMIETREWIRQILEGSRNIPVQVAKVTSDSDHITSLTLQSSSTSFTQSASLTPPSPRTEINSSSDIRSSENDGE